MQLSPGHTLGTYEILDRLGEGGMGVVYRARDSRLNRHVAIKLLSAATAADPHARERLRREAIAAASLDHPYVCKVFEIGEAGGALFLVMEFVAGENLHHRMQQGKLPLAETLRIAMEASEALEEAHERRLLHRDLKPANIMLTGQGHVKVMDFGLAKQMMDALSDSSETLAVSAGQLTAPGTLVGTPDYMSPEQISGGELDSRSDQFSLGVILAEMLSGSHPFRRTTTMETLSAVLRDQPEVRGDMPPSLRVIIRRMLSKDREERFPSMGDVRTELKRMAAVAESGEEDSRQDRLPPIGREGELKLLVRHLEDAMVGRGSIVLIGGEPGIGKTHLTTALAEHASLRGALVRTGHCYEGEGAPPYSPYIESLETSLRTGSTKNLRHVLGDDAAEIARIMPELRTVFPDIPPPLEVPLEQQRRLLLSAYRSFLERVSRLTPMVYIFEDMHWADESTLTLFEHMAKHVAELPQLVIVTYRDVDLEVSRPFARTLESLTRQKLATRILLRRLPVEGVEQMLAALSAQTPPKSLARVVFEETEGNPFFVEEVFRHLAEEGKLFDEKGAFIPGLKVDQLQVPEGVRLVLGRRLQRLGDEARRILTTAAVIGRSFPLELLEELEKTHPDAALDAIEEAERAHLVESQTRGRETRYRFVHELVRQTLIETLSLPRRQRLHARIADAIERVYAKSIEAHVSALAHHLYEAGAAVDTDKAIQYLTEAAAQAKASAAYEEALVPIENALSILEGESSVRVGDLHYSRGNVLFSLHRAEDAIHAFEAAADLFEQLGDWERFLQACYRLGSHFQYSVQIARAEKLADRMKRVSHNAPPSIRWSYLNLHAGTLASVGRIDEGLQLVDEAAAMLFDPANSRARLFGGVSRQIMFYSGRMRETEAASRQLLEFLDSKTDQWHIVTNAYGLLYPSITMGRPQETAAIAQEIIPIATRLGHSGGAATATGMLAAAQFAMGQLDRAGQSAPEAWDFAHSANFGYAFSTAAAVAAMLASMGRMEEALALAQHARTTRVSFITGWPEAGRAFVFAAAGRDIAEAEAGCRAVMQRPGASRSLGNLGGAILLAEALALKDRISDAASLLTMAERAAEEWHTEFLGFPAHTGAGVAAAGAGDFARSEEHHRTALTQMDAGGYKVGAAIARIRYADMLLLRRGEGDLAAARALLEDALERSQAMGLVLYEREARRKLGSIGEVPAHS